MVGDVVRSSIPVQRSSPHATLPRWRSCAVPRKLPEAGRTSLAPVCAMILADVKRHLLTETRERDLGGEDTPAEDGFQKQCPFMQRPESPVTITGLGLSAWNVISGPGKDAWHHVSPLLAADNPTRAVAPPSLQQENRYDPACDGTGVSMFWIISSTGRLASHVKSETSPSGSRVQPYDCILDSAQSWIRKYDRGLNVGERHKPRNKVGLAG